MRQTQGSILCPSCHKLIDVDEERCPYCGRWQPGMFGYAPAFQRLNALFDPIWAITWYSILLYLLALALDPRGALTGGGGLLGILSPSTRALFMLGMTYGGSLGNGHWYTMFSAIFLHGGLLHIGFNLLWIRSLGPPVEDGFGPARTFIIFMASAVGGFLVSNLVGGAPTVGASGGIFGLLAASVVYGRAHGSRYGDALSRQALMWAGLLLLLGFMGPHTNNLAHIGGFAAGYLAARSFLPQAETREGPLVTVGALALALLSVAAVIASLVSTVPYFLKG